MMTVERSHTGTSSTGICDVPVAASSSPDASPSSPDTDWRLLAHVSHELNNPLDGILRYVNLAIRALETGRTERLNDYLTQAHGGLIRMSQIVRELVEFSRSAHAEAPCAGVNSIVEEAVTIMSDRSARARVSIQCRLSENMPTLRDGGLFQVFCNLIKNAMDAMPHGGTLTIVTELDGPHAVIRFEDTGEGLPADIDTDTVFKPFYTTKQPGRGMGLGLAICRDIVEKHDGTITAARLSPGGTSFTIRIPLKGCVHLQPPAGTAASEFGRDQVDS